MYKFSEGNTCWNCSKLAKCPMLCPDKSTCFQSYLTVIEFAKICGFSENTFYRRIKRHGIKYAEELAKKNGIIFKFCIDVDSGKREYVIYKEIKTE